MGTLHLECEHLHRMDNIMMLLPHNVWNNITACRLKYLYISSATFASQEFHRPCPGSECLCVSLYGIYFIGCTLFVDEEMVEGEDFSGEYIINEDGTTTNDGYFSSDVAAMTSDSGQDPDMCHTSSEDEPRTLSCRNDLEDVVQMRPQRGRKNMPFKGSALLEIDLDNLDLSQLKSSSNRVSLGSPFEISVITAEEREALKSEARQRPDAVVEHIELKLDKSSSPELSICSSATSTLKSLKCIKQGPAPGSVEIDLADLKSSSEDETTKILKKVASCIADSIRQQGLVGSHFEIDLDALTNPNLIQSRTCLEKTEQSYTSSKVETLTELDFTGESKTEDKSDSDTLKKTYAISSNLARIGRPPRPQSYSFPVSNDLDKLLAAKEASEQNAIRENTKSAKHISLACCRVSPALESLQDGHDPEMFHPLSVESTIKAGDTAVDEEVENTMCVKMRPSMINQPRPFSVGSEIHIDFEEWTSDQMDIFKGRSDVIRVPRPPTPVKQERSFSVGSEIEVDLVNLTSKQILGRVTRRPTTLRRPRPLSVGSEVEIDLENLTGRHVEINSADSQTRINRPLSASFKDSAWIPKSPGLVRKARRFSLGAETQVDSGYSDIVSQSYDDSQIDARTKLARVRKKDQNYL